MQFENKFLGKTALITGGLGFVGSNLAARLANLNMKKVILVDSLIPELGGNLANIKELENRNNLEVHQENIQDIDRMKSLIKDSDFIFNLAGSGRHTKLGENELKFDLNTNLTSQVLFLEACRQVMLENHGKGLVIVFAGTRDQYGKVPLADLPVREDYLSKKPTDYQSISKNAAESYHMILNDSLREQDIDIKITSLRITNTYGPKQSTKTGAVIPFFIERAVNGESIELWGGGEVLRDCNYIDDVVDALLLLATSEVHGEVFNLGCCVGKEGMKNPIGKNLVTIKELAEKIVSIAGKGALKVISYPEDRKVVEPGHFAADISKIAKLGWAPRISLEDGLKRTIKWRSQSL